MNGVTLISIFLICLPIIFFASSIQMLVASFVRSTKEAARTCRLSHWFHLCLELRWLSSP